MVPVELWAAVIGAGVAGLGSFISYAILSAKHEQWLSDHDKKFLGVDDVFRGLDQRFVPRNEINAQLEAIKATSGRIEAHLNLLSPLLTDWRSLDRNPNRERS